MSTKTIFIVGGYGEVGRRLAAQLEATRPGRVIVGGRHPQQAQGAPARQIDVDDPASVDRALQDVDVVVACVRQREPHLLRAAVRRGIAYTSIAPPWMPWSDTTPLHVEAAHTGARIVLAAGLEPGISSVLVRASAERLGGQVESIETALLLSLGDSYGPDSMGFIFEEVTQPYSIVIDGMPRPAKAFERPKRVDFPSPVGPCTAYTMPFRDQLYYPATLGAKTAIARIALDPPWLARGLSAALRLGLRSALEGGGGRDAVRRRIEGVRRRYAGRDAYALVVEVSDGRRMVRSTVAGREQAAATAAGVGAITEALWSREVSTPGAWLAEQVISPAPFFARLAAHGIVTDIGAPSPLSQETQNRFGGARAHP